MNDYFEICIILQSEKRIYFNNLQFGHKYLLENDNVKVMIGNSIPIPVTVISSDINNPVKSIEYNFITKMKNYHKVIIPESGRWFPNAMRLVTFWRSYREFESGIDDTKIPIFIFTGKDMFMGTAVGIVGENYETRFKILEPESNRALNVHTGHISLQIKRGTETYPIPERLYNQDNSITEYIYYSNSEIASKQPWVLTLREFSDYQRKLFNLSDIIVKESMFPIWCTWADWHSNDINEEMILENVVQGLQNGIKNYIIDDGWFGPGLDNEYSVKLNIGDWTPDSNKIKDMKRLVSSIKEKGANAIIWCAPHAVAEDANCFSIRKKYLIADETGKLILNPPQFYSLCFMSPTAREIMADICANFIKEWDFDGAKYDLFNWVPNIKCNNPNHEHDVNSMVEGLNLTLELINKKTRALKRDYIVELKQNYGTPFFTQWGTMMRAGDAPYDSESNFLRTMHIHSYTPFSVNDYQTFTECDTPEDIAVSVLKMISVGIPSYSINFKRLSSEQKSVIKYYNEWYNDNIEKFMNYRVPCDAENNVLKLSDRDLDVFFLINEGGCVEVNKNTLILNASYKTNLFIKIINGENVLFSIKDCFGIEESNMTVKNSNEWLHILVTPGGSVNVIIE